MSRPASLGRVRTVADHRGLARAWAPAPGRRCWPGDPATRVRGRRPAAHRAPAWPRPERCSPPTSPSRPACPGQPAWPPCPMAGATEVPRCVHNAAVVGPVGPVGELPPAELAAAVTVNLTAPMLLTNAFLAAVPASAHVGTAAVHLLRRGAQRPIEGWAAYCAAKAGGEAFFEVVAAEAARRDRRVRWSASTPGVMDTGMQATLRGVGLPGPPAVRRPARTAASCRAPAEVAGKIVARARYPSVANGLDCRHGAPRRRRCTRTPGMPFVDDGQLVSTNPATGAEVGRFPVADAGRRGGGRGRARPRGRRLVGRARLRRPPRAAAALAGACSPAGCRSWPRWCNAEGGKPRGRRHRGDRVGDRPRRLGGPQRPAGAAAAPGALPAACWPSTPRTWSTSRTASSA